MNNQDKLSKAWQELSGDSAKLRLNAEQPSKLPLEALKRNLKIKLGFTLSISVIWVGFILFYPEKEVKYLFGILLLAYAIGSALLIRELRVLRTIPHPDEDLLSFLERSTKRIKNALKTEENLALWVYPISATAGFMVGFTIQQPLELIFEERIVLYILFACIVVITPISHFLTKWLNKLAFGKHINQQESIIQSLKSD
jgi:hypothetical protein